MRIGLFGNAGPDLDRALTEAAGAEDDGFASYWLPQVMGLDALTVMALAGARTSRIELGTAVLPIQLQHPFGLASQALTAQAASGGRLTLGLGLSHRMVTEAMWGIPWDRHVQRLNEYLDATLPLLAGETVKLSGETLTARGAVNVAAAPPPVLIAALGPRLLKIAGERSTGTITWCTGPQTLSGHVIPTITQAADAAGRPAPRIVAALPVAVTTNPDDAKALAAEQLGFYSALPSYRAMLDREGVEGPADLIVAGSEAQVETSLRDLADSGVTDFAAAIVAPQGSEDLARTREFFRGLKI
jgi:5,10-methylenetetrahydromethanopterin reductase